MASKLNASNVSRIGIQENVDSIPLDDNFQALKDKTNELVDEISAVSIGTTNAETTDARPYHTNLKNRLDSIWSGQANYIKEGGAVVISSTGINAEASAGQAKINGIDVKWDAYTSGNISLAGAGDERFDVVVVKSDSTLAVVTGTPHASDPVLPAVSSTQKALAVLVVTDASITVGWDARNQGCWYYYQGRWAYEWYIQTAIDNIEADTVAAYMLIGDGRYYETLDVENTGELSIAFSGGAVMYRTAASAKVFDLNGIPSGGNIKIINPRINGNSKTTTSVRIIDFDDSRNVIGSYFRNSWISICEDYDYK